MLSTTISGTKFPATPLAFACQPPSRPRCEWIRVSPPVALDRCSHGKHWTGSHHGSMMRHRMRATSFEREHMDRNITSLDDEILDNMNKLDTQDESVSTSLSDNMLVSNDSKKLSGKTVEAEHLSDSVWWSQLTREMPPDAILWLNAVAIIWGSQHAVIKIVVDDCDTSAFSLIRFALAALVATVPQVLSEWFFQNGQKPSSLVQPDANDDNDQQFLTWRWGAEMGLWMFLGYAFQAIGLEFTTAQRSGFLLYLNVKFVPFFARILLGRRISIPTWASALTAVVGTALLASEGVQEDGWKNLNVGDAWSIAAAATSAMFILRLEAATAAVTDSAALNSACLWVVTAAALMWSVGQGLIDTHSIQLSLEQVGSNVYQTLQVHWVELVYLSAVTTALATYIQTRAQRKVSAERASVIYAMDPVYGAIFSNLLLGEKLQGLGMIGAGLITIAAATNAFLDLGVQDESFDGMDENQTTASASEQ